MFIVTASTMTDTESSCAAAGLIENQQPNEEVFCAEYTDLRRRSVENLLISSHDVIGSSISSSLTFSAMTLPTNRPPGQAANPSGSAEPRSSASPGQSPQNSPRPSPRQQHKRDHSKGENVLSGSFKDGCQLDKLDLPEDSISRSSDSSQLADLTRSASHDIPKDRKETRSTDRSKKKSSWYNALYPTYKSRSDDFKRIFKDVPAEERLIVDYSCALQKDILVHGRIYVSQNYLCFYANIFHWVTSVSLKWKDVTAITKEKTALVIPNAILVCTENEKLFFTSFGARDKTYLMLFRVWQNALMNQQMAPQEMWQWVHACYGDELGLTSDDEDYIPPPNDEDKLSSLRLSVDSFSEEGLADSPGMENIHLEEGPEDLIPHGLSPILHPGLIKSTISELDEHLLVGPSLGDSLPTDMSDTTESEAEKQPGPQREERLRSSLRPSSSVPPGKSDAVCTSQHEGRKIVRTVLPIHIDQLFTLLFTPSKFYLDFHTFRRTTDISHTPWQQNAQTGKKERTISLILALNQSVGPKSTQVCETQVMLPCSKPGELYAVDVESNNSGIPYADSFYVTTHYCLTRTGENESCLAIYCQIKYKKSVWGIVKSFIEKNTWAGLEDFFVSLVKALQVECDRGLGLKKKTRRRRRGVAVGPCAIEATPIRPIIRLGDGESRTASDLLSWGVLIILIFLVCLNALLYYKLWLLEEWTQGSGHTFTVMDLQVLKHPPKSHDDWLSLLQQQETLHNVEMQKWQKVLHAAVQLLRQTEDSLSELQISINPLISKKVLSVLKDTLSEGAASNEGVRSSNTDQESTPSEEL